ncbi:Polynucleotide 5'-hydroxyl-kinase GRC3 [Abortiporus biennis]
MLSAIAARKARLQSQNSPSSSPTPSQQNAPSSDISEELSNVISPSKRKSVALAKPARKKHKKTPRAPEPKPARYFQEKRDGFQSQDDVIVVSDEDVEGDLGQSSGEENIEVTGAPSKRRAWSPSALVDDSSESGSEEEDVVLESQSILDTPIPPQKSVQLNRDREEQVILTTYQPTHNSNLFHLTEEELRSLHPSGSVSSASGCLLFLTGHEKLALMGTYTLTLLSGAVNLAGVTLRSSHILHPVFAPRSSPIPVIESLVVSESVPANVIVNYPQRVSNAVTQYPTVLLVQELRTGIEGLGRICRTFETSFELPGKLSTSKRNDIGLQGVHLISHETHDIHGFSVSSSWKFALSSIPSVAEDQTTNYARQVYLVKGTKKTGKSTFARTLLNRLTTSYKRVAFLECDLGQSEFTPGGMVSLNILSKPVFGPPFTHPSIPYQAHFIGSTTPKNSPSHYLDAIYSLVHTYNLDIQHPEDEDEDNEDDSRIGDMAPLVVNMMGWTKGLGADITRKIEEMVEPSHIFDFEPSTYHEDSWSYGGPSSSTSEQNPQTTTIKVESIPPSRMPHYSASEYRNLSILSYFHSNFPPQIPSDLKRTCATSWNTSLPLCAQLPYELTLSSSNPSQSASDMVILTGPGAEDVDPSELDRVLQCAIVAFVSCDPGTLDIPGEDGSDSTNRTGSGIPYVQGMIPPSPSSSSCQGLALIRSLTTATTVSGEIESRIQLLTPLPPSVVSNSRVLVKGELELPIWGMLDFRSESHIAGVEISKVPFLRWGKGEGLGGQKRRTRRNLMRRGQA